MSDLHYEEARRQARSLLGTSADVFFQKGQPFPARVGVWVKSQFVLVGVGQTFIEALDDARRRQEILKKVEK